MQHRKTVLLVAAFLSLGVQAQSCSRAIGYFYQIPALKGQVVGARLGLFQSARWLRQSFRRKHAKLTLYEYRGERKIENVRRIKAVQTDNDGKFDFGHLPPAHYTLEVHDDDWTSSEWFDVELKGSPAEKASIKVDVSPIHPDCTGGHEIIVN
jgi:hypothetical protein